jgi:hypothetical protein
MLFQLGTFVDAFLICHQVEMIKHSSLHIIVTQQCCSRLDYFLNLILPAQVTTFPFCQFGKNSKEVIAAIVHFKFCELIDVFPLIRNVKTLLTIFQPFKLISITLPLN